MNFWHRTISTYWIHTATVNTLYARYLMIIWSLAMLQKKNVRSVFNDTQNKICVRVYIQKFNKFFFVQFACSLVTNMCLLFSAIFFLYFLCVYTSICIYLFFFFLLVLYYYFVWLIRAAGFFFLYYFFCCMLRCHYFWLLNL